MMRLYCARRDSDALPEHARGHRFEPTMRGKCRLCGLFSYSDSG